MTLAESVTLIIVSMLLKAGVGHQKNPVCATFEE